MKKEKTFPAARSVIVPQELHAQLVAEAEREGVSLNQLVVYKLAMAVYSGSRK